MDLVRAILDQKQRQMQHQGSYGQTLNPNDAFNNTSEAFASGVYNSAPNLFRMFESVAPHTLPGMLAEYFNPGGGQELASTMLEKGLGTDLVNENFTPQSGYQKAISFAGEAMADPMELAGLPYLGGVALKNLPRFVDEAMQGLRQPPWKAMEGSIGKPMAERVDKRVLAERRVNKLFDGAIEFERRKAPRRKDMAVRVDRADSLPFQKTTGVADIDSRTSRVQMMTPDEYLKQAHQESAGRFGTPFNEWMMENKRSAETANKYADDMAKGDKFPMPYIDIAEGAQDGRNRALAAKRAGLTEIPVAVIDKPPIAEQRAAIQSELIGATGIRKNRLERQLESLEAQSADSLPMARKDYVNR